MKLQPLCLAGPTAAGKTALAMAFAREQPLEIISVDSALVYRDMDIGTAKPTPAERAAVPHHLIDIIEPTETYSAARFAADARRLVGEIQARGRRPLLVGGTMLYFKALREGLDAMPAADAAVRAAIDARAAAIGWPAMHAELARVDPVSAARLAPGDAQRVQRALEVWQISGRPLSAWQQRGRDVEAATGGDGVVDGDSDVDADGSGRGVGELPMVSLEPGSRAWLHERIARRFDAMLEAGLVDEVRRLRARGNLHPALPAMRCVGYRQAWLALDGGDPVDLGRLRENAVAATRQLAKRQLTWLRAAPERQVVACDSADALARGLSALNAAARS
jgi:tRNA dimethylallyltransferase